MCMALVSLCTFAQEKGDMAAGLNLGVAPSLESGASVTNFGIGAKFQYNVTNPIRVEAAFDYGFKSNGIDVMTIGINGHYLFKLSDKFNLYPLIGVGFAHLGTGGTETDNPMDEEDWSWLYSGKYGRQASSGGDYDVEPDADSGSSSANKFLLNVGVGAEYSLTDKLSIGAEVKYQYIKDFNRLPISIGLTYRF